MENERRSFELESWKHFSPYGPSAVVNKDTFVSVGCKKGTFPTVLNVKHTTSGGMEIR